MVSHAEPFHTPSGFPRRAVSWAERFQVRELLYRMVRVVNVREIVLGTLSIVSDMSYAWEMMGEYTELMRQRVQRDPFCVLKLVKPPPLLKPPNFKPSSTDLRDGACSSW